MTLDEKKINTLRKSIDTVNGFIESLCSIREDIFETRKTEWLEAVHNIKVNLESEQMLLFIGPYSSGKSTFVNALLGEKELLPTSDKPCTSVITELSFKYGGGHEGKAVRYDGVTENQLAYEDLIKMIDGPRGAIGQVGQYHHIELLYDVSELQDGHPLKTLENLHVRIVDCPGYGSLYITNEGAIDEYIQRANFTFWMSPADKFGGAAAERRLGDIKKKTTTLIPVITMSDLIDGAQKEQVVDDFYEHLGHLFRSQEPRFVSAIKFQQANQLAKELYPDNLHKVQQKTKEEKEVFQQRIDKLRVESGVEQIYTDMVINSQKKAVNDANLRSALNDLSGLLKKIIESTNKEEKHWFGELQKAGWSPSDKYKVLNEVRSSVDSWIKAEAARVASNIETLMIKDLLAYLMKVNGKVNSGDVQGIVTKIWQDELLRYKDNWAEHFEREYHKGYLQFSNDASPLAPPTLGKITDELTNMVMSVLEAFKEAGVRSVITGGLGAAVFASTGAVSGIMVIGSALAAVTMIVGPLLILVATVPLLPAIFDKLKQRKEQYRKEIEARLREWMKEMNIAPAIVAILHNQNEKLYRQYRDQSDMTLRPLEENLERCRKIKSAVDELKETISSNFPEDFKG